MYSEEATKFCKIFPLLLTTVHTVKSKGKISQNFVAFSKYMNFNKNNQVPSIKVQISVSDVFSDLKNQYYKSEVCDVNWVVVSCLTVSTCSPSP